MARGRHIFFRQTMFCTKSKDSNPLKKKIICNRSSLSYYYISTVNHLQLLKTIAIQVKPRLFLLMLKLKSAILHNTGCMTSKPLENRFQEVKAIGKKPFKDKKFRSKVLEISLLQCLKMGIFKDHCNPS